jgi:hypothetical protein
MVFFNYIHLFRNKNRDSGRIRALSKGLTQLCRPYRSRLIGSAYFALSGVLGFMAFTFSREEAIEYWERTFLPSEQVVRFSFGSRGLVEAGEGYLVQKAFRSLPSSIDAKGSIWLNADPIWVAVFLPHPETGTIQAVAYCFDCKSLPKNWEPKGIGWRALDKTLETVDIELSRRKSSKMSIPPQFLKDPREILY